MHVMARAIDSPLNPPIARWVSYLLLFAIDMVVALLLSGVALAVAYLSRGGTGATTTGGRVTMFWAAHMTVSAYLIFGVTAWRESLRSWVWRFRGRVPPFRDHWLGDRSGNSAAVLTFVLIGLLVYACVLLPMSLMIDEPDELAATWPALVGAPLLASVLILTFGAIFQWNSLIFGRTGNVVVVVFLAALAAPYYIGVLENSPLITQLSPFAHFSGWFGRPETMLDLFPIVLGVLFLLGFIASRSFRGRMQFLGRAVDRKLDKMGAVRTS
jgi:hypothetical protein